LKDISLSVYLSMLDLAGSCWAAFQCVIV
jgi:hypothetical protein